MHIANLVDDEDRPEGIRKPNIPALDLDDWDDDAHEEQGSGYTEAIALAAADGAKAIENTAGEQSVRRARALALSRFKAEADRIKEETGASIGFRSWAYTPKPKAAYDLWKKVVPLFHERPDVLCLGATALAKMLDEQEEGFTVTRDMLYDKLNDLAVRDAKRLLQKLGITLALQQPVSIASLRRQFIERRDAAAGVKVEEAFSGKFVSRDNTVFVNGRPYKIQGGKSGKPRIQFRGGWLRLDVLRDICMETSSGP